MVEADINDKPTAEEEELIAEIRLANLRAELACITRKEEENALRHTLLLKELRTQNVNAENAERGKERTELVREKEQADHVNAQHEEMLALRAKLIPWLRTDHVNAQHEEMLALRAKATPWVQEQEEWYEDTLLWLGIRPNK